MSHPEACAALPCCSKRHTNEAVYLEPVGAALEAGQVQRNRVDFHAAQNGDKISLGRSTVRFIDAIYVLHAFQKKSKKGIATLKLEQT